MGRRKKERQRRGNGSGGGWGKEETEWVAVNSGNRHRGPPPRLGDRGDAPPGFFSFLYLKKNSKIYGGFKKFQPLAGRQDLNVKKIYI